MFSSKTGHWIGVRVKNQRGKSGICSSGNGLHNLLNVWPFWRQISFKVWQSLSFKSCKIWVHNQRVRPFTRAMQIMQLMQPSHRGISRFPKQLANYQQSYRFVIGVAWGPSQASMASMALPISHHDLANLVNAPSLLPFLKLLIDS